MSMSLNLRQESAGIHPLRRFSRIIFMGIMILFCSYAWAADGMTEKQVNDLSVSLRDYFEARIIALEKATQLAYQTSDKRFESMNEFRGQLKDQANTFLTRNEHIAYIDKIAIETQILRNDIASLREFRVAVETKASMNSVIFVGSVSLLSAFLSLLTFFKHRKNGSNGHS